MVDENTAEVSNDSTGDGTGLGLEGFLSNSSPSDKKVEESVISDDSKEEAKEEEVKTQEADTEEVSSEKEATDTETDEATLETKDEEVSKSEDKGKEDLPDPGKEKLEKQLKDTRTWGNAAHMEVDKLKKVVAKLEAQADGTYQEDAGPSPEEIAQDAKFEGRVEASKKTAEEKYGKEYVAENLTNPDSEFQKMRAENPLIDMRLRISEVPFMEAVNILNEEKFFDKYTRNPESIKEKIRQELEVEVREQVNKEFKAKLKEKDKLPKDIGDARGAQVAPDAEKEHKPKSMSKLFSIK